VLQLVDLKTGQPARFIDGDDREPAGLLLGEEVIAAREPTRHGAGIYSAGMTTPVLELVLSPAPGPAAV